MPELSITSSVIFYILLVIMGILTLVIWVWQIMVLKGRAMNNPDGTFDCWREQKLFYGIAVADIFFACPANVIGIVLVFTAPRWGCFTLAIMSCWWIWTNTMTTATSLRFENPKITLNWLLVFPFGALLGLAYLAWSIIHFDAIFSMQP